MKNAQSLHPVGVYALPDETVLFLVEGMDMINGLSMDIYAVRLDKQGNTVKLQEPNSDEEEYLLTPNPAKDYLYLHNGQNAPVKYTIFDLGGRVCFNGEGFGNLEINTSYLSPGLYFMEIDSGKVRTKLKPFVILD
jgi:hypothetical protein